MQGGSEIATCSALFKSHFPATGDLVFGEYTSSENLGRGEREEPDTSSCHPHLEELACGSDPEGQGELWGHCRGCDAGGDLTTWPLWCELILLL